MNKINKGSVTKQEMNPYNAFLRDQILITNTALGSVLAQALMTEFGVKADHARKLLERATEKGIMKSSKPLTFGKGKYLYLNPDWYFTLNLIKENSISTRPTLYRLLDLLDLNVGVVSYYEALKLTASPEEKTSTKVSLLKDMLSDLRQLKLTEERQDIRGIRYVLHRAPRAIEDEELHYKEMMTLHYERMRIDALFIRDMLHDLDATNLIDSDNAVYRGVGSPSIGAKHNGLLWDAIAYSRTTGINPVNAAQAKTIDKQTLVVLDAVISRKYEQIDLDGFYDRIQIHINSVTKQARKVVPMILYYQIDDLTLNRARKMGFLTYSLAQRYGSNISKVMNNIQFIFMMPETPNLGKLIEQTLSALSPHVEESKALRGALFEALMKPVFRHFYSQSLIYSDLILTDPEDGMKKREFDFVIISSHPKEIVLVELKGYPSSSSIALSKLDKKMVERKGTIKYFAEGSVPLARRHYKLDLQYENYPVRMIFMTTGGYYEDGQQYLRTLNTGKLKPAKLDTGYDGAKLVALLRTEGFTHEASIITKYFSKEDTIIDAEA